MTVSFTSGIYQTYSMGSLAWKNLVYSSSLLILAPYLLAKVLYNKTGLANSLQCLIAQS
uniref:Uncharacterized protein n=1 Tax=Anguilla anguilla TaxID=7936 RepID=A0A0E9V4F1_ANGAN